MLPENRATPIMSRLCRVVVGLGLKPWRVTRVKALWTSRWSLRRRGVRRERLKPVVVQGWCGHCSILDVGGGL